MTSTQLTLSREELLEHAALDAFGLLDEYDTDRYNRSFDEAAPTVQDEVRRLQAELAIDPTLIAVNEEPPFGLRERVLAAVAAAIEREEAQLAPLATIGRGRQSESGFDMHRARFASSGMFWRAASFVLAAGCLLMAYRWSDAVRQGNEIAMLALNRQTEAQLQAMIGPDFNDFVKSNGSALSLRPVKNSFPGQASLYFDESKDHKPTAFLVALRLPALPDSQVYTLRVTTADSTAPKTVGEFGSNGVVVGLRLANVTAAMVASMSWEILNPAGEVVLRA